MDARRRALMFAHHCDREGCDTWQRLDTDTPQFTTIAFPRTWNTREHHFCSLDCLMHWAAAHSMPTQTVPTEGNH